MKTEIDFATWNRTEHFKFFNSFEEPFFGVVVDVDCTTAYNKAKEKGVPFFLYYLHCTLKAVNQLIHFKYRVEDDKVYLYDEIHASATINRPDDTFGFSYITYYPDLHQFTASAKQEIARVQDGKGVELRPMVNLLHISAIPWVNFKALTHARSFSFKDSVPKISYGKMTEVDGVKTMPVSVTVHHGLADGRHVGEFIDLYQQLLNTSL
ncbi:CatA-like O-acetyltransferase [Mucilaginibacter litoreus]|uniref:CatA-like O-acetyltransferase n=1 Tax=Mucilaginibacter litoreus TaxID=1048221 RepID=A0ABW3ATK4_9SPHI